MFSISVWIGLKRMWVELVTPSSGNLFILSPFSALLTRPSLWVEEVGVFSPFGVSIKMVGDGIDLT